MRISRLKKKLLLENGTFVELDNYGICISFHLHQIFLYEESANFE